MKVLVEATTLHKIEQASSAQKGQQATIRQETGGYSRVLIFNGQDELIAKLTPKEAQELFEQLSLTLDFGDRLLKSQTII